MKVLKGATLIDGTGADPIPNATVVVDGERIVDVGPADAVTSPPGASVVDLSGMTLLPGLIDCHDHLGHTGYGLMDRWELDAPASLRHLRTAQVLQDTLEMGYTSVRDAGGLDHGFQLGGGGGADSRPTPDSQHLPDFSHRRPLRRSQSFRPLLPRAGEPEPAFGNGRRARRHSRQGA